MPEPEAVGHQGTSFLRRLVVLVDCTYALVIVITVAGLPTPRDTGWAGDNPWDFLVQYSNDYLIAVFGLILIISYWLRSKVGSAGFVAFTRSTIRQTAPPTRIR